MKHTDLYCDILVAGGGAAGVPTAIAAARNGAKVILCQDRSVLGGNASSEVRMHIVGADASGKRGKKLETEAREGGIIEEIRLETSVRNPQRSPSMLDLIYYEKCRENDNLTLLLNTVVTDAITDQGHIKQVVAERQSTEDIFTIKAAIFVDCTGDGRLGKEAGAAYFWGRESKETYNEEFANDEEDNYRQGSSLLFQARDIGYFAKFQAPTWARKFTEEDLELRPHASSGTDKGLEYGYWWVEWGGTLDTIKDNETIRDELLAIMLGVWDHIKNEGDHGADNWALEWFGFLPGKRESRRFKGMHVLTQNDLINARPFKDSIAYGGWPIDLHPPEGIDATDVKPTNSIQVPHLYDIPLSACVSKDIENLMFAGRNISATHVAFASTRVMATCAAVGQGVGTAAAHAAKKELTPHELLLDHLSLSAIQQNLLRDDAYLIGITNEDASDYARKSTITASSERNDGRALNIISGQTRATFGSKGVKGSRGIEGTNRWISAASPGTMPEWIELSWDEPFQLGEIRLVFDSGQHRVLTLSHSDDYVKKMRWGGPQPEVVKHYTIECEVDGKWQTLIEEKDNYQRLCIHSVSGAPTTKKLRINVYGTHGSEQARINEVRAYPAQE
ncbi:hypothetical protein J14TS2_53640 [Bacillus sp. J14TS2]|uniref:FAD-dependent oxidoreductase n=1 Tax=Bacillus sp. J14TS2 TaxID=2807188 RepID=UPI001B0B0988|nr:FAD-dependent oxidoreductase [Bacillus sp. J14TS2]GIN74889.1 hypothetical protein J14TS2_53640 [Bacillus sp. J14TS2]